MNKVILQGISVLMLFFIIWFAMASIDWVNLLDVEQNTEKTEEKIGNLYWDLFSQSHHEIEDESALDILETLVTRIAEANDIDPNTIRVHLMDKDEINAFALPNGHLVVYSGLISACNEADELSGVLAHEIAHVALNHVMKKLIKEVGLSVLITMTGSGGGADIIRETLKTITSTAYDRNLEKEADMKAVEYLKNAGIDPVPFANFLYTLSESEPDLAKNLSWIMTHPASTERAEYIIEYSQSMEGTYENSMNDDDWDKLNQSINTLDIYE